MINKKWNIDQHVAVFDGFFSQDLCQDFINLYNHREHTSTSRSLFFAQDSAVLFGNTVDLEHHKAMLINKDDADPYISQFQKIFWSECYEIYKQKYINLSTMERHSLGYCKIQKTSPGQGYHGWHSENGTYMTTKRFAFIILYLNTINDGGETEFLYQNIRVQPITGRLVIAPSSYTHMHRGNPPLSQEKYILTSWLEFFPRPEDL